MKNTYISIKRASEISGLSRFYLYRLSASRKLPILKVSNRVILKYDDFIQWLEKHRIDHKEAASGR